MLFQVVYRQQSNFCGVATMPKSVNQTNKNAIGTRFNYDCVASDSFAVARSHVRSNLKVSQFHFFTVTVVPSFGSERISNSSIIRFTPGKPSPSVPPVLWWSCMADWISAMPGPGSMARIKIPFRCPS